MARYVITFNQNADSFEIVDNVGGGVTRPVLWRIARLIVAAMSADRNPGYTIDSISQTDARSAVVDTP